MRPHRLTAVSVVLLAALAACSQSSPEMAAEAPASMADAAPVPAAAPVAQAAVDAGAVETETTGVAPEQLASSAATYSDPQRRFIRTAQAEFQVEDVYRTALAIEDEVAAQGGFVADNDIATQVRRVRSHPAGRGRRIELSEYTVRGELTVRVPSERTQAFLRAIAPRMEFLERRNFRAVDAQFDLLRRQLAQRRGQETQSELGEAVRDSGRLDRKSDAIQARDEARSRRDEALVAQKEFEDRIAFSTITLVLHQDARVRRAERVDVEAVLRDGGPGFFRRLGDALAVGWRGGQEVAVALAALWPLWLLALAVAVAWRRWRRNRKAAG